MPVAELTGEERQDECVCPQAISGPSHMHCGGWLFAQPNSLGNHYLSCLSGASFKGTLNVGPGAAIRCSPVPSVQASDSS